MESVDLGHPVSEVLWMTTIGKKLQPLVQEDAMKHMKYAVVVATCSTTTTTAYSMDKRVV